MPEARNPAIACLILAAGESSRLGEAKQLVTYRGQSLIRRSALLAMKISREVFVVTGSQAEDVSAELEDVSATCIINHDWQSGMGTSISIGVKAVGDQADGILILLCDQWMLSGKDLDRMVSAWKRQPGTACIATWKDSYGPPVIFPRRLFGNLENMRGKSGAKSILEGEQEFTRVPLSNACFDLDTPEDLARLRARESGQA
jgi:molybdenum cofactor cytidylyltransferase